MRRDPGSWLGRDAWLAACLIAVLACSAYFFRLGGYRTLGSHEAFAAVPAREMLLTGDWIVPRFGGLPRLEKPPLPYWTVAAAATLCGQLSEWTARLPAAISALGLAALVGWWAARWYGPVTGFATALAQLTAVYAVTFGRKAEIDMLLWLCMTAALCLVARQPAEESRGRAFCRWIGIYALLSVAWLAKFHYGPVLVLAPTIVFYVVQRRSRSLAQLANPVGLLLFAAAVLVWPSLVLRQVPWAWDVWRHETLNRATGGLGREPAWFYLPQILWMTLPWMPLALAAVPASWRRAWRQGDVRERFLWVWFIVQLGIVSASADKHKHYVAPALPVLSFFAGRTLATLVERYRRGEWRLTRGSARLLAGGSLAVAAGGGAAIVAQAPGLLPAAALAGLVYVGGGSLAIALFRARQHRLAAVAVTGQCAACFAIVIGWMAPVLDHRRPIVEFTRTVDRQARADSPVCVYRMNQDSSLFYLGGTARRIESIGALRELLAKSGRLQVLTFQPYLPELKQSADFRLVKMLPVKGPIDHEKYGPRFLLELSGLEDVESHSGAAVADSPRAGRRRAGPILGN
jgi:4-amino-4-deoxy-L-arabinose transferase-like glycosyltransferase